MAAQGAFGTDFYDRSTRTIVGTMLWTEYRPVIKIGPKGALGSHEMLPIHSAPSLGQSIPRRMAIPFRTQAKYSFCGAKLILQHNLALFHPKLNSGSTYNICSLAQGRVYGLSS